MKRAGAVFAMPGWAMPATWLRTHAQPHRVHFTHAHLSCARDACDFPQVLSAIVVCPHRLLDRLPCACHIPRALTTLGESREAGLIAASAQLVAPNTRARAGAAGERPESMGLTSDVTADSSKQASSGRRTDLLQQQTQRRPLTWPQAGREGGQAKQTRQKMKAGRQAGTEPET